MNGGEDENPGELETEKLGHEVDSEIRSRLKSGSGNCGYDERVILSAAIEQITEAVEDVEQEVFLVDTENLEDELEKWRDHYSS